MTTKKGVSPLQSWHDAHGATMMWDDGYPWVATQGTHLDFKTEYESIRYGAGIMDYHAIFTFEVKGSDARLFIQRSFTNVLEGLVVGQIKYGAFVDADGILLDEGNVYKMAEDRYLIMANAPYLVQQLRDMSPDLEAKIEDITDVVGKIAIQGPKSYEVLQKIVDEDFSELKYFRFKPETVKIAGCDGWIGRTGYSGEKGYEIYVDYSDALKVWEALIEAGAVPYGVDALDVIRVEAGFILIYDDFELGVMSPYDLSIDHCIKDIPENLGNEALKAYGANPPKRLKTLKFEGEELPKYMSPLIKDGLEVGTATTTQMSPLLGGIALAIIDTEFAEDGTELLAVVGDKLIKAEVAPICLYDPEKKKPRGPVI